jgi:hypothetical protein
MARGSDSIQASSSSLGTLVAFIGDLYLLLFFCKSLSSLLLGANSLLTLLAIGR